ncbi:MAG: hypothetical protein QNJ94_12400 [Alphaproteobacteria bacterium]|nr:hypothetical protein [Alphaproteobacteria bacterium]
MTKSLGRSAVLGLAFMLAACGEEPVSDVSVENLLQKAAAGDAAAFKAAFEEVKGKKIVWSGAVVESRRQYGDDYIEEGILFVDVDPAGTPPVAEAQFKIPPSRIDTFKQGQAVTFTAIIREYQLRNGPLMLFLEMKEVN